MEHISLHPARFELLKRFLSSEKISHAESFCKSSSYACSALLKTFAVAEVVLGDPELAAQWLFQPAIALDRRRPVDLLGDEQGFTLVSDLLVRLEYGVFT